MRIVTDPVVDSVAFLVKRFVLPPIFRLLHLILNLTLHFITFLIANIASRNTADKASEQLTAMVRLSHFEN